MQKKGRQQLLLGKKSIESFADYVNFIQKNCKSDSILFRGQRQNKPLLPRIARIDLTSDLLTVEKQIFTEFKRQSIPYLDYKPQTDWDWLALMQHYGLPTRLLDWTLNPLAALWFAVRKPPATDKDGNPMPGGVWIFPTSSKNFVSPADTTSPFTTKDSLIFRPNHITRRIVAQSGWFTVHRYLENEKHFLPLERNAKYIFSLVKINVPASLFPELRTELSRFGINSATMFPDLEGLGAYIEWANSYLADEVQDEGGQKAQSGLISTFVEK